MQQRRIFISVLFVVAVFAAPSMARHDGNATTDEVESADRALVLNEFQRLWSINEHCPWGIAKSIESELLLVYSSAVLSVTKGNQMTYEQFINGLSFRFVEPHSEVAPDGWFHLTRKNGSSARLLSLANVPLDLINTTIPVRERNLKRRLRALADIPRMSTFAVAALIHEAVGRVPPDATFVNIGLWNGFTFLAGAIGHPDKRCVGVDNFSQFGGPREAFGERFEKFKGPKHRFYDLDYREYFTDVHREPIGFYIYDGDHTYDNQLLGLQTAEPYFSWNLSRSFSPSWDALRSISFFCHMA